MHRQVYYTQCDRFLPTQRRNDPGVRIVCRFQESSETPDGIYVLQYHSPASHRRWIIHSGWRVEESIPRNHHPRRAESTLESMFLPEPLLFDFAKWDRLRCAPVYESPETWNTRYTGEDPQNYERLSSVGWLVGRFNDLAYLIYNAALPERTIDTGALRLEEGVTAAPVFASERE